MYTFVCRGLRRKTPHRLHQIRPATTQTQIKKRDREPNIQQERPTFNYRARVHTHKRAHTQTCTHANAHTRKRAHKQTRTHANAHARKRARTQTGRHSQTHYQCPHPATGREVYCLLPPPDPPPPLHAEGRTPLLLEVALLCLIFIREIEAGRKKEADLWRERQ